MIKSLSPLEAKEFLNNNKNAKTLDVRESWEREIASLPDSVHIRLKDLKARADELPFDAPIIVYCHHGSRSLLACAILIQLGFKEVYNLKGGIDAWSRTVDKALQTY